jgi:hypothetical protein|tara:strand:+ start:208 stop:417 length:210 start_codon:yes stop_codon:yes gene_type:complete
MEIANMNEENTGAICTIKWKDTQEVQEGYHIKFGEDKFLDDDVFFYVKDEEELKLLNEEFEIVEYKLWQ